MSPAGVLAEQGRELEKQSARVEKEVKEHVLDRGKLAVVQAPPGSGKTYLLLKAVEAAYKAKRRVAIATQTNAQADDICDRIVHAYPGMQAHRFAAHSAEEKDLGDNIEWVTGGRELPEGRCVVVATTAKWGLTTIHAPFDLLFVEEAWQMSWADFMLLGRVAERFVLIGDPGQIPPVVSVDVARWETSPRPPHRAAPKVILEDPRIKREEWSLPGSRRLPADAVDLVRPFYDFEFGAYAAPGSRAVITRGRGRTGIEKALGLLQEGSTVAVTIPTPDLGPPVEFDEEVAKEAVEVVKSLLRLEAKALIRDKPAALPPRDIGLVATHRVMNAGIERRLPRELRGVVKVDTVERWQGLERPVMVVVHPLSGVIRPSSFDLETGRLCVMASRHMAGMIVVGRDHIGDTLREFIPTADQPLGRPDVSGRGLKDNLEFWERLETGGRVLQA